MKRYIFILIICAVAADAQQRAFNAPDLGKTHFIVGLPAESISSPPSEIVCATDLSGKLRCHDGSFKQVFFSPDDDLEQLLIDLINQEQTSIKIAVFSFTDGAVAQALINAHRRGVAVEIVTDISATRDRFNKIEQLKKQGIQVFFYNPKNTGVLNNIMHHKFALFGKNVAGKSLVWTGSFNFTKSATMNNQENVLVLDEIHLIEKYTKQFGVLKERTGRRKEITA